MIIDKLAMLMSFTVVISGKGSFAGSPLDVFTSGGIKTCITYPFTCGRIRLLQTCGFISIRSSWIASPLLEGMQGAERHRASVFVTQIVNKGDEGPTITTFYARTTTIVSDDLEERGSSEPEGQPDATTESNITEVRVKQTNQTRHSLSASFSSGTDSPCSMVLPNAYIYPTAQGPR